MSNICVDCGIPISNRSTRCRVCGTTESHRRRGHKISPINPTCIDCGTEINRKAKRCRDCANKKRRKYPVDNRCKDCEKLIDKRATRCPSCEYKSRHDRGYWEKHSKKASEAWRVGKYDHVDWSRMIKKRWLDGMYNEEECRKKMSQSKQKNWEDGAYDNVVFSSNRPTGIELQIAAALDITGIEHEMQFHPENCRYFYDEYISKLNLLLEVDGAYWHSSEIARKRDQEKDQWAIKNGYRLLRIGEQEIGEKSAWAIIVNQVLPLMKATL